MTYYTRMQFETQVKNGKRHIIHMASDIFHEVTKKCAECISHNYVR